MLVKIHNSNTTLVKVKYTYFKQNKKGRYYSNTTLVKVKLISFTVCLATLPDSNTTLVKVKLKKNETN